MPNTTSEKDHAKDLVDLTLDLYHLNQCVNKAHSNNKQWQVIPEEEVRALLESKASSENGTGYLLNQYVSFLQGLGNMVAELTPNPQTAISQFNDNIRCLGKIVSKPISSMTYNILTLAFESIKTKYILSVSNGMRYGEVKSKFEKHQERLFSLF